jgi:hypothetical protein
MCCSCDASCALDQTQRGTHARFAHERGQPLLVEAEGEGPEGKPVRYRFKRQNDEQWTGWLDTNDLAGSLELLGTDVRFQYVKPVVQDYLEENATLEDVLKLIQDHVRNCEKDAVARNSMRVVIQDSRKRRQEAKKKKLLQLEKRLPDWTRRGRSFRLGKWSLIPVLHVLSLDSNNSYQTLLLGVSVRGPLKFRAELKHALRIIELYDREKTSL